MTDIAASAVQAASTAVQTVAGGYDEILKGYLIKALEKTGNLIDKSVDLVSEEAPKLVHEVLQWYFAYNLIWFIVGVVGMLSIIGYWIWQINWGAKQRKLSSCDQSKWYRLNDYDIGLSEFRLVFNVIMVIPFINFMLQLNLEWLKIWIAPRLWLIEYATHLIKGH